LSRTQMNDRTNKVLTKTWNNQDKGNRTPVEWLSGKGNFNDLKIKWKSILEKDNPIKLKNMLLENLTSDREKSFIARNLTETQYIMRRIKNGFLAWQYFISENQASQEVKTQIMNLEVLTVSGSVTQRLRSQQYLGLLPKDRELSAEHHSVDSSICAILGTIPEFRNTMKSFIRTIDNETGEIKWSYNDLKPLDIFSPFIIPAKTWSNSGEIIKKSSWILSYKYMTKLDKYNNIEDKLSAIKEWKAGKISGETVYGWVKKDDIKYEKKRINLSNFKDNDIKFLYQKFEKTYEESSCLNSKNHFESLKKIWTKYYINEKENPFLLYMNEHVDNDEEFRIAKQLNHIKLMDGKLNASISRMTFVGDKPTIGLDLSYKVSKNAYMSKLGLKCIYIIKDSKQGIKFLKEDWLNTGEKYCLNNNFEIIDIIEIGTIYEINEELFRVSSFDISGSKLTLSPIQGISKDIRSPYKSFIKMNPKKINRILI
ncbi:MAG: hypothetical protein KFW07_01520, partial [Mycoplasmataceae bacterium]|nr:hypothetical protein [Mycoplasmataceae bacterium]